LSFIITLHQTTLFFQSLIDDSEVLCKKYPSNARNIKEQQTEVIHSWNYLQEKTLAKKQELQSSLDYHKFESLYKDLLNFTQNMIHRMSKLDNARDTGGAQILLNDHDELRLEIDARKNKFEELLTLGKVIDYEVDDKVEKIGEERRKMEETWVKKKVYLDQLIDLMIFLRDVANLESICARQETILSNIEVGEDVEECQAIVKKHNELVKVIQNQEEKFALIREQAAKLIEQRHFESKLVQTKIDGLSKRRERVKELANIKSQKLNDLLVSKQIERDVVESLSWMDEKKKQLESSTHSTNTASSLEDKIKKLKKHKAFQAELNSNANKIEDVIVKSKNKELAEKWSELVKLSDKIALSLEEAQDILEFTNQLEKTEQWMREKELLVSSGELGEDYEHCLEILKKLDDSDVNVDDQRMKSINALAKRLIEKTGDSSVVQEKIHRLNTRWGDLKDQLAAYRTRLGEALEVHAFEKGCDELEDRITSKIPYVSSEELGEDDESVELLMRKLDSVEKEMSVIEVKIKEMENEGRRLLNKTTGNEDKIEAKMAKVNSSWNKLKELCNDRKNNLQYALEYTKYVKKLRELETFTEVTLNSMKYENPESVEKTEELIAVHGEIKIKIDSKKGQFDELGRVGDEFVKSGHPYTGEIKKCVKFFRELEEKLTLTWVEVDSKLKSTLMTLKFLNKVKETEGFMSDVEAVLSNQDVGVGSLEQVQELIRKHEGVKFVIENTIGGRVESLGKEKGTFNKNSNVSNGLYELGSILWWFSLFHVCII